MLYLDPYQTMPTRTTSDLPAETVREECNKVPTATEEHSKRKAAEKTRSQICGGKATLVGTM